MPHTVEHCAQSFLLFLPSGTFSFSVTSESSHQQFSPHQEPGCCFSKSGLGTFFLNHVLQLWLQGWRLSTRLICSSEFCLYVTWSHFVTSHSTQVLCFHVLPGLCFTYNLTHQPWLCYILLINCYSHSYQEDVIKLCIHYLSLCTYFFLPHTCFHVFCHLDPTKLKLIQHMT